MGGITTTISKVKYIGIASLTIAILSILILNIISSYSSSNVRTNATNAEPTTSDTSALASIDPTAISISISSHSATGDSNDGNLSLSIPQGGGLVAGRHTVSVNVGSEISKYSVYLNGGDNQNNTDLVNHLADSLPNTGSLATSISSLSWSEGSYFEYPANFPMYDNGWGVALPDSYPGVYSTKDSYEKIIVDPIKGTEGAPLYLFSGMPPLSVGQIDNGGVGNAITRNKTAESSVDVYYGVKVDNPSTMLAGDYTTNVIYTVVAELKAPSIDSVSPNPIRTGSSNRITLEGDNLDIVSKVTIDDRGAIRDCTSLTHSGSTKLTCTLPAISNAGSYIITAKTAGEQTTTTTIQVKLPTLTITSVSPNEINTNNSTTTLTITGTNLATTSSVYIDFNKADSGETCTIRTKANGQVTCTAPSRSSAGGPYTVRLTTDGGSVSKTNAVSYVTPVPVVTSVSPSAVDGLSSLERSVKFTISGKGLSAVSKVTLYLANSISGVSETDCVSIVNSDDVMTCTVRSWRMCPHVDPSYISANLYDPNGSLLISVDSFCKVYLR